MTHQSTIAFVFKLIDGASIPSEDKLKALEEQLRDREYSFEPPSLADEKPERFTLFLPRGEFQKAERIVKDLNLPYRLTQMSTYVRPTRQVNA